MDCLNISTAISTAPQLISISEAENQPAFIASNTALNSCVKRNDITSPLLLFKNLSRKDSATAALRSADDKKRLE